MTANSQLTMYPGSPKELSELGLSLGDCRQIRSQGIVVKAQVFPSYSACIHKDMLTNPVEVGKEKAAIRKLGSSFSLWHIDK
jgi:hypothetical protein